MEQLPKEPTPEEIEQRVEKGKEILYGLAAEIIDELIPEFIDEFDFVLKGTEADPDRKAALDILEHFIEIFEKIKGGEKDSTAQNALYSAEMRRQLAKYPERFTKDNNPQS